MTITRLLLTCMLLGIWKISVAGQHDWIIQKLPKNLDDQKSNFVVGYVGKQKYLVIEMNSGDETKEAMEPVMVVSKVNSDKTYEPVAVWKDHDMLGGFSFKIKNNSIYIQTSTAHHGVYFTQYQFMPDKGQFFLVGWKAQSMTLSDYGMDALELNNPNYRSVEMWGGESVNLLTSKAECWLQIFYIHKSKNEHDEWERAMVRFNKGYRATKGVRREIGITPKKPLTLEGFDFSRSSLHKDIPFTCYFDAKGKFHGK